MTSIFSVWNSCTYFHFDYTRLAGLKSTTGSRFIHFFMIFLLLTFMYDKNKASLLTLPFQTSSSLFHSNLNWPSNVTSNNPFTLVVPGIFQIFHTCTYLVFPWISFLASGRYCPSRESKREEVKACAYLVKKL